MAEQQHLTTAEGEPAPELQERITESKRAKELDEQFARETNAENKRIYEQKTPIEKVRAKVSQAIATSNTVRERIRAKIHESGKIAGIHTKAGFLQGKKEVGIGARKAFYNLGRAAGRAPLTVAEKGIGHLQRRGTEIAGQVRATQKKYGAMGGLAGMGGGVKPIKFTQAHKGSGFFKASPTAVKYAIPRGLVKSYYSSKVKSALRSNIRRWGAEEGLQRTRSAAAILGWKMP